MNERGCPPDYNGGFCADYDVDCKACWEQWEQEHKAEEASDENKMLQHMREQTDTNYR